MRNSSEDVREFVFIFGPLDEVLVTGPEADADLLFACAAVEDIVFEGVMAGLKPGAC